MSLADWRGRVDRVLQSVMRLRRHREHEARREHALAEEGLQVAEQALQVTTSSLSRSREGSPSDIAEIGRRHVYAVRLEMVRRQQELRLREAGRREEQRRQAATHAARAAKVVELVAESRAAEVERISKRRERERLDQAGMAAWWRRE